MSTYLIDILEHVYVRVSEEGIRSPQTLFLIKQCHDDLEMMQENHLPITAGS